MRGSNRKGKSEEWWRLNATSIMRGVEGKWFQAWGTLENMVKLLIEKAREENSTPA
jgi:hypothetical protein